MIHGDGDILLVCFEHNNEKMCYVVIQKDISDAKEFNGRIGTGQYYDWETPYGYGGPLVDTPLSEESQHIFETELIEYCTSNNIVTQFLRFHPLLKNYDILPNLIETRYLRDTIFIDTSDENIIMPNMDTKSRNMVRKAQKNGVVIIKKDIENYNDFIPMYCETMKKNGADEYYSFKKDYYESLKRLKDNAFILYAMYEDKPISGSIIFYNKHFMHYHLSGSYNEYRKYSPNNLLLYEGACWAAKNKIKQFHLGGGISSDDSLFGFKKQFNKNGRAPFVVGRTIFDKNAYDHLLQVRKSINPGFDVDNEFMIQYRR